MHTKTLKILCSIQAEILELIDAEDKEHSSDDVACGVIEGKLAAYRDVYKIVNDAINKAT